MIHVKPSTFMHILGQCWCVLENATPYIAYCELPYIGFLFKNVQHCISKDVLTNPKTKAGQCRNSYGCLGTTQTL